MTSQWGKQRAPFHTEAKLESWVGKEYLPSCGDIYIMPIKGAAWKTPSSPTAQNEHR